MNFLRTAGFATLMVALSSIGFGLVPFFARHLTEAGMAAPAIALYRYMFPATAFLPFLRLKGQEGRASLWGFGSGFLTGLGWIGYVKSLELMSVSTAGVLYMTYPMFTLAVGWLLFREPARWPAILGSVLIIVAAVLATGVATDGKPLTLFAIFCGLTAPLSFGLAINVLAHRLVILPPLSRIASFATGSALGLLPLVLSYPRAAVLPVEPSHWILILSLGLLSALLPQLLYNTFVPRIGGARAAALGSVELPTMFFIGWLSFGETPGWREIAAGVLVLTAILMTPTKSTEPEREP